MPQFGSTEDHRPASTDTTRLLAAGTYVDADYRRAVLESTVRDPARFVCPSFGADVGVVVRHALRAQSRADIRDVLLLGDLAALVVVVLYSATRKGEEVDTGFRTTTLPVDRTWSVVAVLVLGLTALAIVFADAFWREEMLWRHFVPGREVPPGPEPQSLPVARQVQHLDRLAEANLIVFASRAPFVGSGARMDGGTAAIKLQGTLVDPDEDEPADGRERPRNTPVPFDERELLDRLTRAVYDLDLPGLRVQERIYVNGMDASVALGGRVLRGTTHRPVSHVEEQDIKAALADPLGPARLYMCTETTSWHGHLVTTTFTRVVKLPELLYVESSTYALPPLRGKFLAVDTLPLLDPATRMLRGFREALASFGPLLVKSPVNVLRAMTDTSKADRRLARHEAAVRDGLLVDQGAVTSVRQSAASTVFGTYYLEQDMQMHSKAVATRIAEELQEFLAEHGYDIGEISFRKPVSFTHIENSGYIGSVGTKSQGSVQQMGGEQPQAPAASTAPAAAS
jgi:hypothetical protein